MRFTLFLFCGQPQLRCGCSPGSQPVLTQLGWGCCCWREPPSCTDSEPVAKPGSGRVESTGSHSGGGCEGQVSSQLLWGLRDGMGRLVGQGVLSWVRTTRLPPAKHEGCSHADCHGGRNCVLYMLFLCLCTRVCTCMYICAHVCVCACVVWWIRVLCLAKSTAESDGSLISVFFSFFSFLLGNTILLC